MAPPTPGDLRIGVSSCLLGNQVRYDGGHKRDRFLADLLGRFVTFVPICPEVEVGMGTPREPLRLIRIGEVVHLVAPKSGEDHTIAMERWAARRVRELERLDLCGYVLKKDSPSCGMERVKVYGRAGAPARDGRGLFAAALMERMPLLPVEEEGRLNDLELRENFIERVFACRRLKGLFAGRWTQGDLVRFHTTEKLLLLAHDPAAYRALGRLVARGKSMERRELQERYGQGYLRALGKLASPGRHANVLQHMAGYLREALPPEERQELATAIEDYRRGLVPLVAPLTLMRHHLRRQRIAYLEGQVYLEPHPKELMLRNHV